MSNKRPETVLDESSLHLKPIRRGQGTPNLKGLIGRFNTMQFSSKTTGGDWINYNMTIKAFNSFCEILKDLGSNPKGGPEEFLIPTEKQGAFSAELKVGRDMDGVIYMQLRINSGESEKYVFKQEPQYKIIHNGEQSIPAESHYAARAWVAFVQPQMNKQFEETYQPSNRNGNGGGGYQQGGNGGGGYQQGGQQGGYQQGGQQQGGDYNQYVA